MSILFWILCFRDNVKLLPHKSYGNGTHLLKGNCKLNHYINKPSGLLGNNMGVLDLYCNYNVPKT